jgi:hypothetical protein
LAHLWDLLGIDIDLLESELLLALLALLAVRNIVADGLVLLDNHQQVVVVDHGLHDVGSQ